MSNVITIDNRTRVEFRIAGYVRPITVSIRDGKLRVEAEKEITISPVGANCVTINYKIGPAVAG